MFTLLYVPARLRCPVRLLECPDRTSLLRPGGLQHATRYHAAGAGTGFQASFRRASKLHLLETGFQVIRPSPYRADLLSRRPVRLGTAASFLPCYFPVISLSALR